MGGHRRPSPVQFFSYVIALCTAAATPQRILQQRTLARKSPCAHTLEHFDISSTLCIVPTACGAYNVRAEMKTKSK